MLKVCFESLGLAWTDDGSGTVALTSVGKSFLKSRRLDKLAEVAAKQVRKWQLVNPCLHIEADEDLRVFPYYATVGVLAGLPDCSLTREEIREPGRRNWRLYGAEIKARFWQVEPTSA